MAPSRRTVLATGAAGLVTAAASANAQTTGQGSPPQPVRPGRGGTDPGPRNTVLERQNPDLYPPPDRSRHAAEPALLLRRRAYAPRARRLDAAGHGARARHLEEASPA